MTRLAADDLQFSYGGRRVLAVGSLRVEGGEVVGLVGPNGSGKTTLLRCLAGLLPASGRVRYGEAELRGLSAREQASRRAYVPQSVEAAFPFTVGEMVALGRAHRARLFTAVTSQTSVGAALAEVGFEPPASQRFDRLSGGERQQVMVARALVQEAPLLLLDEPTSALDLKHRSAIVAALRRRAAAGAAVLLSLHDLNLAGLGCDRLVLLDHGRVIADGPPAQVLIQERVEAVYGVRVVCREHPVTGSPVVDLDPRVWR